MIARLDNFSVSNMFGCCSKTATSPHDQDVAAPVPALEEAKDKRLSIEVPPFVLGLRWRSAAHTRSRALVQEQQIGLLTGHKPINHDSNKEPMPAKSRSIRSYAMYIIWLCTGTCARSVFCALVLSAPVPADCSLTRDAMQAGCS
jgi:hypothetical protein